MRSDIVHRWCANTFIPIPKILHQLPMVTPAKFWGPFQNLIRSRKSFDAHIDDVRSHTIPLTRTV